jgi:hypothetical protein
LRTTGAVLWCLRRDAARRASVDMSVRKPSIPQAVDAHRTAYRFPDEHGGNIILGANGKATWEHADGSKDPLNLDDDVVKVIADGIKDVDMHAEFAERRVKEAQAGGRLERTRPPREAADGAKGEWLKDPDQREDQLVAQGPRFSMEGVTIHLLDNGTAFVWRGGHARKERLDIQAEVQRAIVNAAQNLLYARNLWESRFGELVRKG